MRPLPDTLFGRAAFILLGIFVVVQGVAMYTVWTTVVEPLAQRSADDLAARMVLAAQTWVELPPETRADYEIELSLRHGLELGQATASLANPLPAGHFGDLLQTALSSRTGQTIRLQQGPDPDWAWAEITLAGNLLRIGFPRERYELEAPLAAGAVFLGGALLTLMVALLLARRTATRLRDLARSAAEVGQGRAAAHLPETGPEEIRALNAAFNRMSDAVQSLLENRTVLLSGISHDLRTPLTRLRLGLSLLDDADPATLARLDADVTEMNRLISQMLDFARGLQAEDVRETDLAPLLDALADQAGAPGEVQRGGTPHCPAAIGEPAFRRVVGNLLENARRYGEGRPVELVLECAPDVARVWVLDRGPGIPAALREAVFRPFHRLEGSRARDTGGSGLGLAIARQLADAYGWRIELADREGGGLAASLIIPRRPAPSALPPPGPPVPRG